MFFVLYYKGVISMMVYIWLGVMAFMVIIELSTTQLVSIWFAVGALASFFAAMAGAGLPLQIILFAAVSAVALALTRPLVKKMVNRKAEPTNADMVIGKTGIVTEDIDNLAETGTVKVGGAVWSARSDDGSIIEKGEKVKILEIKGVKLFVIKTI